MSDTRALLLDLDNTVYAYAPCHEAGLNAAQAAGRAAIDRWPERSSFAAAYGEARDDVKALIGGNPAAHSRLLYFKRMGERALGRSDLVLACALEEAYWRGYREQLVPDPGCLESLRALREQGMRIAWVTNYTTRRQIWKLEALAMTGVADFLCTSEEVGLDKPSPRVLELALRRLGAVAGEACMIGDEVNDLRAAEALGMPAVLYHRGASAPARDDARIVRDWGELRALFRDRR